MFGQSYALFKITAGICRLGARACGASDDTANKFGAVAGTYVGGWAALITVDPAGGAAIAIEVANKVDKSLNDSPKPS